MLPALNRRERFMKRVHAFTSTDQSFDSLTNSQNTSTPPAESNTRFLTVPTPLEVGLTQFERPPHKKVQTIVRTLGLNSKNSLLFPAELNRFLTDKYFFKFR